MSDATRDTVAIGIGLGSLGLATGAITGATVTAGASQALITGILTFVGGTVLSYSAFATRAQTLRKAAAKKEDAEPPPANVARIGVGLTALALALMLGALIGMWFRYRDPFDFEPKSPVRIVVPLCAQGQPVEAKPSTVTVEHEAAAPRGVGMQNGFSDDNPTWVRVNRRLTDGTYAKGTNTYNDINELVSLLRTCR